MQKCAKMNDGGYLEDTLQHEHVPRPGTHHDHRDFPLALGNLEGTSSQPIAGESPKHSWVGFLATIEETLLFHPSQFPLPPSIASTLSTCPLSSPLPNCKALPIL
ncbi:hypothetical protein NXS19_005036 [Fusarium pseudograminearum]|nr:hypothetical protein NXS19_005036 [Fusarium pseudograminearum]